MSSTPPPLRHLRWLLPLVAAPLVWAGLTAWLAALVEATEARQEATPGEALLGVVLLAGTYVAPVVLLVVACVQARRVHRAARLRAGRFTKAERAVLAEQAVFDEQATIAWRCAVDAAQRFARGERPPTMAVWDVVPLPGEEFYADVPVNYSRYYGVTVQYSQTSGLFMGHPAFVLAGLAGTALANASARSAAEREAADQWREHCVARLVVSDQRLLVQRGGQWLSFPYSGLTAVYPDPERRGLVCQYPDTSPLMLRGHYGPLAAVVVVAMAYGSRAVVDHPAMAPIAASVHAPGPRPA